MSGCRKPCFWPRSVPQPESRSGLKGDGVQARWGPPWKGSRMAFSLSEYILDSSLAQTSAAFDDEQLAKGAAGGPEWHHLKKASQLDIRAFIQAGLDGGGAEDDDKEGVYFENKGLVVEGGNVVWRLALAGQRGEEFSRPWASRRVADDDRAGGKQAVDAVGMPWVEAQCAHEEVGSTIQQNADGEGRGQKEKRGPKHEDVKGRNCAGTASRPAGGGGFRAPDSALPTGADLAGGAGGNGV